MSADDMLDEAPTPEAQAAAAEVPKKPDTAPKTRTRSRARKATGAAKKSTGGRPPKEVAERKKIERNLTEAFGSIGLALMLTGNPVLAADGQAVIERAEPLAQALGALAEQNQAVARVLSVSLTGGAWFGVIAAASGLGVAIAQNHGVLPGGLQLDGAGAGGASPFGDVDPATLAAMFATQPPAGPDAAA